MWENLVTILFISILTSFALIKFFCQKTIDHYFAKTLKKHEHELQMLAANINFDYSRKIQDFTLYTTKRHDAYVSIHKSFLQAVSDILFICPLVEERPAYSTFSLKMIEKWLDNNNIDDQENRNKILQIWDTDRTSALLEIDKLIDLIRIHKANNSYAEAHNLALSLRLYLSHKVTFLIDQLETKLAFLIVKSEQQIRGGAIPENIIELRNDIENTMQILTDTMKSELATSYYEENR